MALLELAALIAGMVLITYSSEKTVEYSTHIAAKLKVPAIVVGVLLVSVGTDLPEIANSIFSSYTKHGDINVGNALGSCLSQMTIIFGIVAMLGGTIIAHRKNILILGACAIAGVIAASLAVMDGALTRMDAALLLFLYAITLIITVRFSVREVGTAKIDIYRPKLSAVNCIAFLFLSSLGVVAGAVIIVNSIVELSQQIGLPEYLMSFFLVGVGTSLPEFSVELAAIKRKQYGIVVGDMLGSNIIDATLALGIGPLLFPTRVSAGYIFPLALYVIFASVIVIGLFAWRGKIDKKAAAVLIAIYFLSFVFVR